MSTLEIIILGIALSADAFAVTISNCFIYGSERRRRLILMPIFFGVFQALMPLLGYFVGGLAAELIERYSGIVTLIILGIIGGNMIREGVGALRHPEKQEEEEEKEEETAERAHEHLSIGTLFVQAIATAIDAFAVGVSLRAQAVNLPAAVSIIGLTTFCCCLVALFIGRRLGRLLGDRAEVVGGVVLVAIGVKAFLGF